MICTYQYRLRPTVEQVTAMERWLDMLRHQYNWMLAGRFDWYEYNRCRIDACPLTCSIVPPTQKPEYYSQKRSLVQLKQDRPWYREIHSQVLQEMVKRVKLAFDRYLKGDSKGKRSGRPRFKGKGRYRSFTYPQIKPNCIDGSRINLPKIGKVKLILHRPIPDGFKVKTAQVSLKADGWYVSLLLEEQRVRRDARRASDSLRLAIRFADSTLPLATADNSSCPSRLCRLTTTGTQSVRSVPNVKRTSKERADIASRWRQRACPHVSPEPVDLNKSVGIDLGLKEFLVTSNNQRVAVPQYFRKSEVKLAKLQRQLARQKKGSTRWKKQANRVAKLHQKIARQREDFFSKVWEWLFSQYDVVIHEKLNIKGLARTPLAKSILDAAWGKFLLIGAWKAERAAKLTVAENPNGTSIDCSGCGERVPKTLVDRQHICPSCNLVLCRDLNAAINLKQRVVGRQTLNPTGNVPELSGSHCRSPLCTTK